LIQSAIAMLPLSTEEAPIMVKKGFIHKLD
jgi:hypothetical protein